MGTSCNQHQVVRVKIRANKKVLLRERKRHTARRVASTRYAVPVGATPPPPVLGSDLDGEVPPSHGTPPSPPFRMRAVNIVSCSYF